MQADFARSKRRLSQEQLLAEPLSLGWPLLVSPVLAGTKLEKGERCRLPAGPRGLSPAKRCPASRAPWWL